MFNFKKKENQKIKSIISKKIFGAGQEKKIIMKSAKKSSEKQNKILSEYKEMLAG